MFGLQMTDSNKHQNAAAANNDLWSDILLGGFKMDDLPAMKWKQKLEVVSVVDYFSFIIGVPSTAVIIGST